MFDWPGITTSNQLIAFSTTITMIIAAITLGFFVWDRTSKPLRIRRWQARRRMDATCGIQYTRFAIEEAAGQGKQLPSDASFDEIVAHTLQNQIKNHEWHTLQTVPCRIEPLGHERVEPRQSAYPNAGIFSFPYTRLSWMIQLPIGTAVTKNNRIVSNGRTYNVTAVFDEHSESESVHVAAISVQS